MQTTFVTREQTEEPQTTGMESRTETEQRTSQAPVSATPTGLEPTTEQDATTENGSGDVDLIESEFIILRQTYHRVRK